MSLFTKSQLLQQTSILCKENKINDCARNVFGKNVIQTGSPTSKFGHKCHKSRTNIAASASGLTPIWKPI